MDVSKMTYSLPADLEVVVNATIEDWRSNGKVKRLWTKDASALV